MDIIVLAGGLSPERQVSLVSGQGICRALRGLGHRAVLVDMFLGLEAWEGEWKDIFDEETRKALYRFVKFRTIAFFIYSKHITLLIKMSVFFWKK